LNYSGKNHYCEKTGPFLLSCLQKMQNFSPHVRHKRLGRDNAYLAFFISPSYSLSRRYTAAELPIITIFFIFICWLSWFVFRRDARFPQRANLRSAFGLALPEFLITTGNHAARPANALLKTNQDNRSTFYNSWPIL